MFDPDRLAFSDEVCAQYLAMVDPQLQGLSEYLAMIWPEVLGADIPPNIRKARRVANAYRWATTGAIWEDTNV